MILEGHTLYRYFYATLKLAHFFITSYTCTGIGSPGNSLWYRCAAPCTTIASVSLCTDTHAFSLLRVNVWWWKWELCTYSQFHICHCSWNPPRSGRHCGRTWWSHRSLSFSPRWGPLPHYAAVTDDHDDHTDQNDTGDDEYANTHNKVEVEVTSARTQRGSRCGSRSGSNGVCVCVYNAMHAKERAKDKFSTD